MKKNTSNKDIKKDPLYQFDAKPSLGSLVPLGLQHVVAAIVGIVTPALIVARTTKLSEADTTILVQMALIASAVSTFLQVIGIGKIGAKLPVIIGISFAYIPTMNAIGGIYDINTIFGATICGAIAAFLVGLFLKYIRPLFPPIITGVVIFTIGLSLYPVAVRYMAGGGGSPSFGSVQNWTVATFTLIVCIVLNNFTKGITKLASILIAMAAGYALAFSFGMINFDNVSNAGFFQYIPPLKFAPKFKADAIISMIIIFIVNAVQTIGDLSSTTLGGFDREPTDKELQGGIMGSGITNGVLALFGGLPTATYSQNVGIVTVTKVVNKFVFIFAGVVLLLAGLIPKFAAILITIPQPVIGGATITVFASITVTGIRMISNAGITGRNFTIVGLSVAIGVGITSVAGAISVNPDVVGGAFPTWVNTIFASSSVVLSTLSAIILNLVLPKDK